jgi:hypothetical protein
LKASEKVYWMKVGISILAAILCVVLQVYIRLDGSLVFMLGSIFYIVSSDLLATFMKIDRNHSIKIGIGAYIFTWITVWTILYTILKI